MFIIKKDKKYLGRGEGQTRPLVCSRVTGSYVFDEQGKKYIDFYMGWCVGNIGWNNKEIIQTIKAFNGPTYISPLSYYQGWSELAEILAKITPGKLIKSFRATSGTEAVEIALQAAMSHTKRNQFVSIEGSYHGHSIGAMSVGSSNFRNWYTNLLPSCHKVKPPLNGNSAKEIEKFLSNRKIAALIMEPIVCNLAVEIPSKEFFRIVSRACKKYGTLFIADEVASGFGRTGKMFACDHYNLKPDIMCIAKGVTGGYGVLGATIMTPEVSRSFEFDFSFYSTFGWHPLNVAATIANLRYLKQHQRALFKNANQLSKYFEDRLRAMQFRYSANIRVKGLAIGVTFQQADYANDIIKKCFKKGLLIADASGESFIIYPALTIDKKTAKLGLDILEQCL